MASLLRHFYAEVRKDNGELYAKASYVGLRAAVHRHLTGEPYSRQINILQDREFQSANQVFLGMLKRMKKEGLDRSCPKPVVSNGDLEKLFTSGVLNDKDPVSLQRLMWFYITMHFCRRGREGMRSLKKNTFQVCVDDVGRQYVKYAYNQASKNHPGDLTKDFEGEKRMYETKSRYCPVKTFQNYIQKLNPNNESFFQRAARTYEGKDIWFDNVSLGKNKLDGMMKDISKAAGLSTPYTNHSLRATTITLLNRKGFDSRTICTLSGHRCEASIQSYCRDSSAKQKREMSDCLQGTLHPQSNTCMPSSSTFASATTSSTADSQSKFITLGSPSMTSVAQQNTSSADYRLSNIFQNCSFLGNVTVYIAIKQ